MADVRDWGRFIRGRWDWTRFGYEDGFPRGCQFTDIDSMIEFDGRGLKIECKPLDPELLLPNRRPPLPPTGQLRALQAEATHPGSTVLVVYGCGVCNDPYAVYDVGRKEWHIWRSARGKWDDLGARRTRLKWLIDSAMGLIPPVQIQPVDPADLDWPEDLDYTDIDPRDDGWDWGDG